MSPTLTVPLPDRTLPTFTSKRVATLAMPPFMTSAPPLLRSRSAVVSTAVPGVVWGSTRIVVPAPSTVVCVSTFSWLPLVNRSAPSVKLRVEIVALVPVGGMNVTCAFDGAKVPIWTL